VSGESATPRFLAGPRNGVGFLDAADATAAVLAGATDDAWTSLPPGSVLTVYSELPDADRVIAELCRERGMELVATIVHEGRGTTLTIR
jgi:TusA-related sulfurtransferase